MFLLKRYPAQPDIELARKFVVLGPTGSVYTITLANLPSCNWYGQYVQWIQVNNICSPDSAKGHHCMFHNNMKGLFEHLFRLPYIVCLFESAEGVQYWPNIISGEYKTAHTTEIYSSQRALLTSELRGLYTSAPPDPASLIGTEQNPLGQIPVKGDW